ncbi:DUF4183 domain-containing protein [Paenibacillus sp. LjRoot56]|uniref:DUF4183 domain-containing protein n=1 Tax=Paenibacillus sp. LjRoot56 TaxID=3342333 RepID=UPI003ED0BF04
MGIRTEVNIQLMEKFLAFLDDNGNQVVVDSLPGVPADGYFNVYVNGVLQEVGLSTVTIASLVLSTILAAAGTPVVLEVADFSNTISDISTPQNISAPTITVAT